MADLVRTPTELISLRTTYVLREMLQRGFTTCRDTVRRPPPSFSSPARRD